MMIEIIRIYDGGKYKEEKLKLSLDRRLKQMTMKSWLVKVSVYYSCCNNAEWLIGMLVH